MASVARNPSPEDTVSGERIAENDFLTPLGPFSPTPHLAVAVSGGADSMACALLADQWARARGGSITALTVDHGLRPESQAEAHRVAQWMRARGIAHHILTPPRTDASNNLQEEARTRRYTALAEWCRTNEVLHCLIAHNAGDQRETIAHNIARGATADGASGMSAVRNYHGIRFLRPLLTVEKAALKNFLHSRAAGWIEDPSNTNTKFARVRTRTMLQQNDAQAQELSQRARHEGTARHTRDNHLAALAAHHVMLHPAGYAELPWKAWAHLEPTLATQLLADLLTTISGNTTRPRASDTARLHAALHTDTKRRTLHGCEITRRHDTLRIARETARTATPTPLRGHGTLYWDNRFRVHYTLPDAPGYEIAALSTRVKSLRPAESLPLSTPALWHLDRCLLLPHMLVEQLPASVTARIGFAPAKPLAAAPFWWLKDNEETH